MPNTSPTMNKKGALSHTQGPKSDQGKQATTPAPSQGQQGKALAVPANKHKRDNSDSTQWSTEVNGGRQRTPEPPTTFHKKHDQSPRKQNDDLNGTGTWASHKGGR